MAQDVRVATARFRKAVGQFRHPLEGTVIVDGFSNSDLLRALDGYEGLGEAAVLQRFFADSEKDATGVMPPCADTTFRIALAGETRVRRNLKQQSLRLPDSVGLDELAVT